ncbi:hypothetical protein LXL04_038885 [Taraxacum kok-saghyz]
MDDNRNERRKEPVERRKGVGRETVTLLYREDKLYIKMGKMLIVGDPLDSGSLVTNLKESTSFKWSTKIIGLELKEGTKTNLPVPWISTNRLTLHFIFIIIGKSRNLEFLILKMATRLNMLPEDCVSTIVSLTSAADACRLMVASSSFKSETESDMVWSTFLPSDYSFILSRTHSQINFSSKKELYFQLCDSVLIDGGIRSFSLNKISGKKCIVLSTRALSISLSEEANHWTWTTHSASRFSEVIELKSIPSIEIEGSLNTQELSPNTTYGAYLMIQVTDRAFGLDSIASEISVSKDECSVSNTAYLCPVNERKQQLESLLFTNRRQMMEKLVVEGEGRRPIKRDDGWMEIELGEFFVGEKSEDVKMNLMEVKGHQLKGGLWRLRTCPNLLWSRVITSIHNLQSKPPDYYANKLITGTWKNITGMKKELAKVDISILEVMSFSGGTGTVQCFSWRAKMGRIPSAVALSRRGILNRNNTTCNYCNQEDERVDHIMIICPFARLVIEWILKWCGIYGVAFNTVIEVLDFAVGWGNCPKKRRTLQAICQYTSDNIAIKKLIVD